MKPVQPYFVFATYQYHKRIVMSNGIAHLYHYCYNCDEFGNISAIPDGCVDIYFEKDSSGVHPRACGTVLKRTLINNQKDHEYFGIRFMPGVLPANLKAQMKDLIGLETDLKDLLKNKDLAKRIEETQDWQQCIRLFLEDYSACLNEVSCFSSGNSRQQLAGYLKDTIISTLGSIKIQDLSEKTGYSARYINMLFEQYIGLSPKTFERILKFQNAINLLNHHQEGHLTQVGMEAGYFDQAHFIREFKKLTAMTPAEYRKLIRKHSYLQRLSIDQT